MSESDERAEDVKQFLAGLNECQAILQELMIMAKAWNWGARDHIGSMLVEAEGAREVFELDLKLDAGLITLDDLENDLESEVPQ